MALERIVTLLLAGMFLLSYFNGILKKKMGEYRSIYKNYESTK